MEENNLLADDEKKYLEGYEGNKFDCERLMNIVADIGKELIADFKLKEKGNE